MINVKELRIGNHIIDENGCFAKIIAMAPFGHSIRCDEEEGCEFTVESYAADGEIIGEVLSDSIDCRPIPLNPEWLERCGFEFFKDDAQGRDSECYDKWCNGINLIPKDGVFYLWIDIDDYWYSYKWTKIQYLHQLQNLYFALTGQELTIKL